MSKVSTRQSYLHRTNYPTNIYLFFLSLRTIAPQITVNISEHVRPRGQSLKNTVKK